METGVNMVGTGVKVGKAGSWKEHVERTQPPTEPTIHGAGQLVNPLGSLIRLDYLFQVRNRVTRVPAPFCQAGAVGIHHARTQSSNVVREEEIAWRIKVLHVTLYDRNVVDGKTKDGGVGRKG